MHSALGEQEVERFLARERSARLARHLWLALIAAALAVGLLL